MPPKPARFKDWFEFEAKRRLMTDVALRKWVAEECTRRGAKVSEFGIRALVERGHEPRPALRSVLMKITGLGLEAFIREAPTVADGAA